MRLKPSFPTVGLIWSHPLPQEKVKHAKSTAEQQLWPLRVAALVRGEHAGEGDKTQLGSLGEAGVIPSSSLIFLYSKMMGLD